MHATYAGVEAKAASDGIEPFHATSTSSDLWITRHDDLPQNRRSAEVHTTYLTPLLYGASWLFGAVKHRSAISYILTRLSQQALNVTLGDHLV